MPSAADDLVAVLAAQAREYQGLGPILDDEEAVLAKADARGLAEVSARREALAARLAGLERERGRALSSLALSFGVEPRALTISRLIDLLPGYAPALAAARDEIAGILPRLAERNGRNRFVAERTLTWLTGLFASLAPAFGAPAPAYAPTGRSQAPAQDLRLLDRRA